MNLNITTFIPIPWSISKRKIQNCKDPKKGSLGPVKNRVWAPPHAISSSVSCSKAEHATGLHWESKVPRPSLPKSPFPHTAANLFPELLDNRRLLLLQVSELKPIMNSAKRLLLSITFQVSISVTNDSSECEDPHELREIHMDLLNYSSRFRQLWWRRVGLKKNGLWSVARNRATSSASSRRQSRLENCELLV